MTELHHLLSTARLRLTTPRRAVFCALRDMHRPLSITELIALCSDIDRSSIYRSLELFNQLGIIEVVHTGWKKRYELAGPFQPHHHHLQCMQCHALTALDTPELEALIERLAQTHRYQITSHHFELRGTCSNCLSTP